MKESEAGRRRAKLGIGVSFAVSLAGSVGFVLVSLMRPVRPLEGVFLALGAGGLGWGMILWGRHLSPQGPYVQDALPPTPLPAEREEFVEELEKGERPLVRRRVLVRLLGAAAAALGLAALVPLRVLAPSPTGALLQTGWAPGARVLRETGEPVHVDDLEAGSVLTVFPEHDTNPAHSQVVLIRLRPDQIRRIQGTSTAAVAGYIAYSRVCTHAACPVGLYEEETSFLYCPCHQSVFDALDRARPLAGPATRALPQLHLEVDPEGFLRAGGDFAQPVGPAWWNMPT